MLVTSATYGLYGEMIGANTPMKIIAKTITPQNECQGRSTMNLFTLLVILDKKVRVWEFVVEGSRLAKIVGIFMLCTTYYASLIRGSKALYRISINKLTITKIMP